MARPYAEVIGDPIEHSLSPAIHRHWLESLGIEGEYRATRVAGRDLPEFLKSRSADQDWLGCNLTMPLKRLAFDLVEPADETSRRVGAFNTVFRGDGRLLGSNTDCLAIEQILGTQESKLGLAAVIGSGGGASAALEAFRRLGVRQTVLISRSRESAAALLDRFDLEGEIIAPGEMPVADLLINATPLGMKGHDPLKVDLARLPPTAIVFDMVYSPARTDLLISARRHGLRTIDGLTMLILQAAYAFSCFFAAVPDRSGFAALRERLAS